MDENLHDTEHLFYSNLEGHAEQPGSAAWNHISLTLDRDNLTLIRKKYNRLKRFAALLLLILICFGVYEINISQGSTTVADNKTAQTPAPGAKNTGNDAAGRDRVIKKSPSDAAGIEPELKRNALPGDISAAANVYPLFSRRSNNSSAKTRIAIEQPNTEIDISPAIEIKVVDNNKIENTIAPAHNPLQEEKPTVSEPTPKMKEFLRSTKSYSAQNNSAANLLKKKNKKQHAFSIMPYFSPDIAWYRLQDNKPDNSIDDANELERTEQHEFSSTFGVTAEYALNARWSLQSGLNFSNTNIILEPKVLYAAPDIDGTIKYRINTSSGYAYLLPSFNTNPVAGDSLYSFSSAHSLQYVGIPLELVRRFSAGRVTIKMMAGITTNILVHAKVETVVSKDFQNSPETIDRIHGLKKMYFSGLTGVGVEYKVGKRTELSVSPSLRFAVSSINKDNAVRSYPMAFGFNTGLKISF